MTDLQHWGDAASIAGVFLTIIGFIVTIFGVWRSKSAAEQASLAARDTRESVDRYNAVVDLASAMRIMQEIMLLQRNGVWAVLPDRYSELRRRLTAIKASHVGLSIAQHQTLEKAVGTFAELGGKVERAVFAKTAPPNPAKLNEIVSSQIDEIHVVLLSFQKIEQ